MIKSKRFGSWILLPPSDRKEEEEKSCLLGPLVDLVSGLQVLGWLNKGDQQSFVLFPLLLPEDGSRIQLPKRCDFIVL
jgi:hypothetical protein